MPRITIAKITGRTRPLHDPAGPAICFVDCGNCEGRHLVLYGGWDALACQYCSAAMYRFAKTAEKARSACAE